MRDSLKAGLRHRFAFTVPETKTVPCLYPEASEFQEMPPVFATGFMVGLFEWTCLKLLQPHMEEGEGSLGIHIDVSHAAATPPGLTVTVDAECVAVNGRRVSFAVSAHDGIDEIGKGLHERFVVKWDRFNDRLAHKLAPAAAD